MKLILLISRTNKVVRLVNVDAQNSENALERDIDCWSSPKGYDFNITYWRNQQKNVLNPYAYNRVNVIFSVPDRPRITKSYYCISRITYIEDMVFEKYDTRYIN